MTYVATPPSNASNHPKFSLCHRRFEWRNRKSFASPFDLLACLIRPTRTTLRREREKKEWKRRKKFMNKVIFSHRFHYPRRKKGNFVTDAKVQREKERAILFIFPTSHLFLSDRGDHFCVYISNGRNLKCKLKSSSSFEVRKIFEIPPF